MKGDVSIIAIVMIAGIIITLVGATYLWSVPLINKSQDVTTFQTASSFIMNLNNRIIQVAEQEAGGGQIDIPLGFVTIVPDGYDDPRNNSIVYEVLVTQPLAMNITKTYIGGASFSDVNSPGIGMLGSSPSIISLESETTGSAIKLIFQDLFRKLVTSTPPVKGFKIRLQTPGNVKISGGSIVTYNHGGSVQEGDTTVTIISIIPA